jgi:hypothetical protein
MDTRKFSVGKELKFYVQVGKHQPSMDYQCTIYLKQHSSSQK